MGFTLSGDALIISLFLTCTSTANILSEELSGLLFILPMPCLRCSLEILNDYNQNVLVMLRNKFLVISKGFYSSIPEFSLFHGGFIYLKPSSLFYPILFGGFFKTFQSQLKSVFIYCLLLIYPDTILTVELTQNGNMLLINWKRQKLAEIRSK